MLSGSRAESEICRATTTTLPVVSGQQQQYQGTTPKQMRKSKTNPTSVMARNNNGGGGGGSGGGSGGGGGMSGSVVTSSKTPTIMTNKANVDKGIRSVIASGKGSATTTNGHEGAAGFVDGIEIYLGLIGWRKKCLYTLLLLLMLLIITNLVLTLWILKVMQFSTEGMGQLKILPGGIQLSGQAVIMDMLRASSIRSRHGQPISIESSRNFSINTRDPNGVLENHLFLGHDKFECLSAGFRVNDTTGRNLFSVNRNEVTIGAHALRIEGEGGAIFRESIQTPHVRAEPGRELRLESPTRQLDLTAAKDINLQSRAGGIELLALEDVKLRALDGSLRLESSKILMPNLRTAQPPILGSAQSRDHMHRVFQLCACFNGKLFLAAPHSICAGDDSTVCR
ncbi:delta-sarcoglycan [Drosophila nasuta]|uniref:delta-sarcoglycan n=1 Tax=Drosophila nasuta TaxID=42062 RepID=UPI00295E525B|nr:delta-sarcoglycan [Drosophila nasuta]